MIILGTLNSIEVYQMPWIKPRKNLLKNRSMWTWAHLALLIEKHTKTHTTIILKDLDVSLKNNKRLNEQKYSKYESYS